jgi:hypothetical protein
MKKGILKIAGVQLLSKESQKSITGGRIITGPCHCECRPLPLYCSPCFIDPCSLVSE